MHLFLILIMELLKMQNNQLIYLLKLLNLIFMNKYLINITSILNIN